MSKPMFNDKIQKLEAENKELKERENQFWEHLQWSYEIESREELEKESKNWKPQNALVVAIHYMWKRDPKVEKLEAENKELKGTIKKKDIALQDKMEWIRKLTEPPKKGDWMGYKGNLFAKVNGRYLEICHSDYVDKLEADNKRLNRDINLYVEWLCGQTRFSRWYIRGKIRDNNYDLMMKIFKAEAPIHTPLDRPTKGGCDEQTNVYTN